MALPTTRRNIPAGAVAVRIRNAIKDAQQDSLEEIAEQIIDQAILFMPTHDPVRDPDPTVNMAERIGYVIVGDEVRITVEHGVRRQAARGALVRPSPGRRPEVLGAGADRDDPADPRHRRRQRACPPGDRPGPQPDAALMNLLENLSDYLVNQQGIARDPQTPGALPPLYIDPRDGVPAPDATTTVVVGAMLTGGIRPEPRMDELRKDIVDVWIRSRTSPQAFAFEEQLRPALIDRVDWQMGAMWVGESLQWRALQRFSSDSDGYVFTTAYIFERRAT